MFLKIIWGVLIGATSYIMISAAGVDGIKMLSNLGGLPALLLLTAVTIGMLKLSISSFFKK
jgi:choline-glycine betaine transporter